MLEALNKNFGLLIAFVLPGLIWLAGMVAIQDGGNFKLAASIRVVSEIGGLLFFVLAATACGIILSAIRWLFVDTLHHLTGLEAPNLDYRKLEIKQSSFMLIVENNYRYYLFYSNSLVAIVLLGFSAITNDIEISWLQRVRWLAICIVLFLASRDSLNRFYKRSKLIMGQAPSPR